MGSPCLGLRYVSSFTPANSSPSYPTHINEAVQTSPPFPSIPSLLFLFRLYSTIALIVKGSHCLVTVLRCHSLSQEVPALSRRHNGIRRIS